MPIEKIDMRKLGGISQTVFGKLSGKANYFLMQLINNRVIIENDLIGVFSNPTDIDITYRHLISIGYNIRKKMITFPPRRRSKSITFKGGQLRKKNVYIIYYI